MAEVENPANQVPPHKKQLPSSIPNFDTLEGFATDGTDDYSTFKKLQRQLEYVWVFPKNPVSGLAANSGPGISICKRNTSKMSRGMEGGNSGSLFLVQC